MDAPAPFSTSSPRQAMPANSCFNGRNSASGPPQPRCRVIARLPSPVSRFAVPMLQTKPAQLVYECSAVARRRIGHEQIRKAVMLYQATVSATPPKPRGTSASRASLTMELTDCQVAATCACRSWHKPDEIAHCTRVMSSILGKSQLARLNQCNYRAKGNAK